MQSEQKHASSTDAAKPAPTVECVIKTIIEKKLHEAKRIFWASAGFDLLRIDHFTINNASLETIEGALPETFQKHCIDVTPGTLYCKVKPGTEKNTVEVVAWGCEHFSYIFWSYRFSALQCTLRYPRPGYVFSDLTLASASPRKNVK
jgi:hypothetical protein